MKKVLIVEDEILARLGLRQLVDWRKLELELLPDATDGEEALKMIRNSCPDIILLDLNIPKVSGLEILEFLKKEEMPTKVIVVSCQEEFDVVKKAMKLGAYDYLRKLNLSSDELENILEKCLVETEERITVHMQGIREIRYEEIVRDSRDILAGACNYQTLICILAKDTEELSGVMEMIHKWAETELREGLQIQKGNQYGYFLLKEKPNRFQTLSIITAFIGVLFIVKPTGNMNLIPALIGLMGGLGAGLAYTYVRSLGQQGIAGPFIVFFFSAFSCVVLLPFLIFDFHPMTWVQLGTLLLAGLSAAGGQFTITAAYCYAPAREISVFDYFQIPFSALLGFIVFGQIPDWLSWVGYAIICGTAIAMFLRTTRTEKT